MLSAGVVGVTNVLNISQATQMIKYCRERSPNGHGNNRNLRRNSMKMRFVLHWMLMLSLWERTIAMGHAEEQAKQLLERSRSVLAQIEGEIAAPGLREPVEILRDRWGIAHIYAKNGRDLFFAQGYSMAQDRL